MLQWIPGNDSTGFMVSWFRSPKLDLPEARMITEIRSVSWARHCFKTLPGWRPALHPATMICFGNIILPCLYRVSRIFSTGFNTHSRSYPRGTESLQTPLSRSASAAGSTADISLQSDFFIGMVNRFPLEWQHQGGDSHQELPPFDP